jgi:hypothetical protein
MRVFAKVALTALLIGKLSGCTHAPSATAPAEPEVPIRAQAPASGPEPQNARSLESPFDPGLAALLTATGIGSPIGLFVP